jgi:galactosylceramidase
MTATIVWNLITAYYEGLYWWGDSLMDASKPWSGYYDVKGTIWVAAHTTQFVEPGWRYLLNNTGSGFLPQGGSYVTLISPDEKDLSIIIETMNSTNSQCVRMNPNWNWTVEAQTVTFKLTGSFSGLYYNNLSNWYRYPQIAPVGKQDHWR